MNECNAKITTAEVTGETVARLRRAALGQAGYFESNDIPDGVVTKRVGDRLVRVDLHELVCSWDASTCEGKHGVEGAGPYQTVTWHDGTPGATPHEDDDVTVSDAEMRAAWEAMETMDSLLNLDGPLHATKEQALRIVLEAAKRASKEQP